MGKPYEIELLELETTYHWALNSPIDCLKDFVAASTMGPLICVGSGGSLTAACTAAMLHETTGNLARSVTPLGLLAMESAIRRSSVLLLTAGGSNVDIINAFRVAATHEPHHLMALCARTGSPLARLAKKFHYTRVFDFDLPSGRDGFLATNTLLASIILLIRAYKSVTSQNWDLPGNLLSPGESDILSWDDSTRELLQRTTLIALYGRWGGPAAVDLESKFTEAALSNVQSADYRNFAHGRHHWLAKRASETGVIAFITRDEKDLAERTLALLPREVPVLRLRTEYTGAIGSLDLLVQVLRLAGLAGKVRGIDPGRPGVPAFGRRIYHLGLQSTKGGAQSQQAKGYKAPTPVLRKSGCVTASELNGELLRWWIEVYQKFLARISHESFGSVVFDYDGTLVEREKRFSGLSREVANALLRLLKGGIIIGIATGRGQSVRHDLQRAIPQKYWKQILIGYYNGACVAPLADDTCPDKTGRMDAALEHILEYLGANPLLGLIAKYECRPQQITVEPHTVAEWGEVKRVLVEAVRKLNRGCVQVLESSHSIDVVAAGVSKRAVVHACTEYASGLGKGSIVLCIGDSGAYPGNDYELLAIPSSLSVDSVSTDAESCWNLAPEGFRSVQATLWYLERLRTEDGVARYCHRSGESI